MSRKFTQHYADPKGVLLQSVGGMDYGVFAEGTTVPSDTTAGYEPGCFYADRDTTALSGLSAFINEGTAASCDFNALVTRENALSSRLVAGGASLTITAALHDGKIIVMPAACAITLPAMTGSGAVYTFYQAILATTVTITATAAHLYGKLIMNTDSAFQAGTLFTVGAAVAAPSTIITLDGSTKGGGIGDWIQIVDLATSKGAVSGMLNASGTEITPFS